ncbi:UbiD family decarboxylase [bacterium]|nr:UbiD family decarboxylase [bacterium]
MGYKNLQSCLADLEKIGELKRISVPVDPRLQVGAIQRRVCAAGGPALLFTNVTGSKFPMLGNLFGTLKRTEYLFRDTIPVVKKLMDLKIDPGKLVKNPFSFLKLPFQAIHALPKKKSSGPVFAQEISIRDIPQLVSWPKDGGAFITLPQVYSESVQNPGWQKSNLGMYRIQLSGNEYLPNQEIGLHYQTHRGIGVHQQEAIAAGKPFPVNIFIGGAPSMTVSAVMPLPEGIPEVSFAGVLAGHRIPLALTSHSTLPIYAEADFCIVGEVIPNCTKPEGPFGDHLGYYSLTHSFPVLRVKKVFAKKDAIYPFTTVGRPPQEDTSFGAFIHELTGKVIPAVLPGVRAVHAVDATGVHPLLLAIGSERYTPYNPTIEPQEILTQANSILGNGQLSLAKYLFIADGSDAPFLNVHHVNEFLTYVLERFHPARDLHFQTATTIDTLDYSGESLNHGSKLVLAVAGPKIRNLASVVKISSLPDGFGKIKMVLPGIVAVEGKGDIETLCHHLENQNTDGVPLVVVVDDADFTSKNLNNFLWVTFTRSNPSHDVYGVGSFVKNKHWGCTGPVVIDARIKPHHAPALQDDPATEKFVDSLAISGGPLAGLF